MSALRELYYGNICPTDRFVQKGSQYHQLSLTLTQTENGLLDLLCPEGKALYESVCNIQADQNAISESETFINGFRLGAQIMLEILSKPDNQLV